MRRLTSIAGTVLLTLVPIAVSAYVTPEEALFPAAGYNNIQAPPTHRDSGDRIEEQMQRARERREAEWQAAYDAQHPKSPAASTAQASSVASDMTLEDVLSSLKDSIDDLKSGGARPAAREEDTFDDGMTINAWEDPGQGGGSDEVLHSGAPLTPTGAGTWVAVGTILAAIGCTLWRAKSGFAVRGKKF